MASPRTRRRKQQRLRLKAKLAKLAANRAWWASLSNQEKHDADYDRYRIEVLGHSPLTVVQEHLNALMSKYLDDLLHDTSPLYERLSHK